jgi:alcohol dehydrogenase (cytochrome c)
MRHTCFWPIERRVRTLASFLVMLSGGSARAQITNFTPVTTAMLDAPDPGDWLHWRRTQNAWGYSPLSQINKQNVNTLQLVWSAGLSPGRFEGMPLVHDGVLYAVDAGTGTMVGGVQAFDAVTGDKLWGYGRPNNGLAEFGRQMRSIAIFADKIFYASADAHLTALDARTGTVVWDMKVADYKLGYRYTSGPIIVKGKVVAGMAGCDRFKVAGVTDTCFISAFDPETGKEVWRTATVARPGEPGGETWGDLPLIFRAGGDAWIPGSFDPANNTIYWSTAQPKPWGRISRNIEGDALYTSSVLALDPETGKMKWFHQFLPGETLDQDEVFESILVDRGTKSSLFKMGKLGILWEIDRNTGEYIAGHDLGYQNILDLDSRTGNVTYKAGMIPRPGIEITHCPDFLGVRNWRAMSYHPQTQALYIPINLNCQKSIFSQVELVEGGGGNSVVPFAGEKTLEVLPNPIDPDHRGGFVAMDVNTGKVLWRHMLKGGITSSALTTAGGLAIVGGADRYLYIHDSASGTVLYQTRLPGAVTGSPISYSVDGKQYIAAPVVGGTGGGNAIFVFALPGNAVADRRR